MIANLPWAIVSFLVTLLSHGKARNNVSSPTLPLTMSTALLLTLRLKWCGSVKLICDMNIKLKQPIPLYCDNKSAIYIAHNDAFHKRTKHIETIVISSVNTSSFALFSFILFLPISNCRTSSLSHIPQTDSQNYCPISLDSLDSTIMSLRECLEHGL